jgi:hypothetical protein
LESEVQKDELGNDMTVWYLQRNPQFKHLNLCMNRIEDDCLEKISEVLGNSSDDFGFTISGNPMTAAKVKEIHSKVEKMHKKRIAD